jgi:hypothetical protein
LEGSAAKIGARTAWRYLQDPDVLARLREASRASLDQSRTLLQAASTEAVECLRRIVRDAESEATQVTAARVILEMGSRMLELWDIEERLRKLETVAKMRRKGWSDERSYAQGGEAGGVNGAA